MILCALLSTMGIMSSCQKAKLKTLVEITNKQCPMSLGGVGEVTRVTYDGDNLVYTFSMNEEITNIDVLKENPESIKSSIATLLQDPSPSVREMLDLVIKCKSGIQFIYTGKSSGKEVRFGITSDELKDIMNKKVDTAKSDLEKLEAQIKMANMQFPLQASEEVTIEEVSLSDESVVYTCRVNEKLCDIAALADRKETVKKEIAEVLSDKSDTAMELFIKYCLNCNKNIVYKYVGDQSDKQCDVVFSVSELKEFLQH
ncbi:hypothetical protein M1B74_05755 [Bacteroides pyogenes]|nr:hypothetical protein [Bacteroides pyogenes]MBB3895506.1 hypothetical protein [Bacteroides pyogenes]GAE22776.1 hypothetical protein JCM10003_2427 [Bacteroides pyogenes JCM 10003]